MGEIGKVQGVSGDELFLALPLASMTLGIFFTYEGLVIVSKGLSHLKIPISLKLNNFED